MATRLRILWDGEAPGLAEHRLSLNTFGVPLQKLGKAIRGIAGDIVKAAEGGAPRTNTTALVDLQIRGLGEGSLVLDVECMPAQGEPLSLFAPDVARRVVVDFLEALHDESQGRSRNRHVHKFLDSLPKRGVRSQRYSLLRDDGTEELCVALGELKLVEPPGMPSLVAVTGRIVGVKFEPAQSEIRIQSFEGGSRVFTCLPDQVELALQLRANPVRALGVTGEKSRLLWIRSVIDVPPVPSPEERLKDHLERWEDTLRRLSK